CRQKDRQRQQKQTADERQGYRPAGLATSRKKDISCGRLTSVPQGLEALDGGLAKGGVGGDLLGSPEHDLGLVRPLLGGQDQPQVVVGRLQLGIEAQGVPQGFLCFTVVLEVEEGQAEILVRQVQNRQ